MRVISGRARGHKLQAPDGMGTRPTTDRIKESLFNIISPDLYGCDFLDLFSGSGAIGIEALSRGAEKAVFVDNSPVCQKIIDRNLTFTKLKEKSTVYRVDCISAIEKLGILKEKFDIIFMDPPYMGGFAEPVLEAIVKSQILKPDGYIIVERATEVMIAPVEGLKIVREKNYKKTTMTFLMLEEYKND